MVAGQEGRRTGRKANIGRTEGLDDRRDLGRGRDEKQERCR